MADPEAALRANVSANGDSDLIYILEEHGVPLALQDGLITAGFRTLKRFAALNDTKVEVREDLAVLLTLDKTTAAGKLSLAILVAAWQAAGDLAQKESTLRAEAKVNGVLRVATHTERSSMRKVMENRYGKRQPNEVPSAAYLADKLAEMEEGEPTASPLDEICSLEDKEVIATTSGLNPLGLVQVLRTKSKTTFPANSEQLRRRLRVECNTWLMLQAKFPNREWLRTLVPADFDAYYDYLMGRKCNDLQVSSGVAGGGVDVALNPPWSVLLQYEYQLRKAAFTLFKEEAHTMATALKEVVKDQELKELFFLTPLLHTGKSSAASSDRPPRADYRDPNRVPGTPSPQGKGRKSLFKAAQKQPASGWQQLPGKYSKGGKGKGAKGSKGGKFDNGTVGSTPDGRQICYAFNSPKGCSTPGCSRVHVCNFKGCLKQEPIYTHAHAVS